MKSSTTPADHTAEAVREGAGLDWTDVNLATGTLTVGRAKTDAGSFREVDLPGGLIEALTEWKAQGRSRDAVFVTRTGKRQTGTNIDHRIKTAIKAANRTLSKAGITPISERVTPHSLRRTYASVRAALGDDPVYIAEQGGWTDPHFVFGVYQRAAKRRQKLSGTYLAAFDRALDWARIGAEKAAIGSRATTSPNEGSPRESTLDPRNRIGKP